ncbi:hypothetical protein [Psychrobacter immobilis]|uniref:hypothetical protein n=1 Tax=Psychrobacter immobilis TaxID=498 RepID=UPI00191975F2|nr:hypothetical protein [Psychrobacter immobilis]
MHNAVAHQLRQFNRLRAKEQIEHDAISLVEEHIARHPLTSESKLSEQYHAINHILEASFDTPDKFRIARRGFLKFIREYNKTNCLQLDEPVVPVLAERDSLTIGYDWFVKGSQVSQASKTMIDIWQRKRNDPCRQIRRTKLGRF